MNPDEVVGWTQSECRRPSLLLDLQESLRSVRIGHPPRAYSVGWLIPHANNRLWSNDTVVPLAEVHVESDESGRPFCRSLDRQWKLADALNGPLNAIALGKFSLFEPSERAHRLQIGRLLVRREHWSTRGSELKFVRDKSAVERFAGMRKWSDDLGLPRHVFVRFQGELKPVYFDLHSPLYAELLCKLVRALPGPAASVSIGEMVPGPEDLWLHDADGQRYTSELRMVMVDAEP